MKILSRIPHLFVLAAIVGAFAVAAHATSVFDPTVIIRDPACPGAGCQTVGTQFAFNVPAGGSGTLFFTNGSGVNFINLLLTESGVPANAITCLTSAFANCNVSTGASGITSLFLSGINPNFTGIPSGQNFSIVFQCNGNSCWPGGLGFSAIANVPEPTTMALMATGIGALITRRKRWKHAA